MYFTYLSICESILSIFVVFEKIFDYSHSIIYDSFDGVTLYTISHDLSNPFLKIYSVVLVPMVISYDYRLFSCKCFYRFPKHSKQNFYERCIVKDRSLKYFFSQSISMKITNDFKKSKQLSIQIQDKFLNNLQNKMFDFSITATHICVLLKEFLGSEVQCFDQNLDQFTFKDIDCIS